LRNNRGAKKILSNVEKRFKDVGQHQKKINNLRKMLDRFRKAPREA